MNKTYRTNIVISNTAQTLTLSVINMQPFNRQYILVRVICQTKCNTFEVQDPKDVEQKQN